MLEDIFYSVIGLLVLIGSGEFLVRGSSRIALKLKMPPFIVGLTVIAFGTSAPELFTSIQAALTGSSDLAISNVIGSNICNLALVLGVTAILYPIRVGKNSLKLDWPVTMCSSLLIYVFTLEGVLNAWEGMVSFLLLLAYLAYTITKGRKKALVETENLELVDAERHPYPIYKSVVFVALGAIGLYFGSKWFVMGAQGMAKGFGVSDRVIGITVVALGTSLPELVTSVISALKKETDLALGNLLGSNIFNNLAILGITAMVKPVGASDKILTVDMVWMLAITLLVFPIMLSGRRISKPEGFALLAVYGLYTYIVVS
ncbi:MAG: calcium/sodium antiporter [Cytophagales bacterium]|nr:calcium/sodium antiporter [Cytophagales bacterium]